MHDIKQHSSDRDILIAVGEYDPPEFRRQSGEFQKVRELEERFEGNCVNEL